MRTLGLAICLTSVLGIVFACTSLWAEEKAYTLPLAIGSGAVWLLAASIGHRFFRTKASVNYLSLVTTTVVILWWLMKDGGLTMSKGFLLAGLVLWFFTSVGFELRKKKPE